MAKRLYRSRNDRILAGICGGIAKYFDVDPVFIRILAIITVFFSGMGIVAYIAGWILIPEEPVSKKPKSVRKKR